ncbi:unnamed protein product, partial [Oikopleura dioica]
STPLVPNFLSGRLLAPIKIEHADLRATFRAN